MSSDRVSESRLSLQRARKIRKMRRLSGNTSPVCLFKYELPPPARPEKKPIKYHRRATKTTAEKFPHLFSIAERIKS